MSHQETSASCRNCAAALNGPYCSACGQRIGHLHRPIWEIIEDFLHSVVHFDGRVWRTLRSLFLRPGEMSAEWADGKQVRYVPPIRLFIFTSLLLVIALSLSDVVLLRLASAPEGSADSSSAALYADDRMIVPHTSLEVLSLAPATPPAGPMIDDAELQQLLGAENGQLLSRLAADLNTLALNPRLANEAIGKSLSRFMMLAVPLMACLLWLFYRGRFLAEHIVFALNTHTFFFISLLGAVLLVWISRGFIPGGWLLAALWAGFSLQFLLALKRMYQQGWGITIFKSAMITGVYIAALLGAGTYLLLDFLQV